MEIPPVVEVVPYNEEWPTFYEAEAEKIRAAIGQNCVTVHHIGSTAVPGLAAKPIIDILVVVKNILHVDQAADDLALHGYAAKGENGIPFRRFFHKRAELPKANVHIYEEGNPEIARHLHFREHLKKNPDSLRTYANLKQALAKKHAHDIDAYTIGKEAFVKSIDQQAGSTALRLRRPLSDEDWQLVGRYRSRQPYLREKNHFLLYRGVQPIGYAEVQQKAISTLVLDLGYEQYKDPFVDLLSSWIAQQIGF